MKRNYLLIFSVFLFMLFCVNIDGVKAANDKGYIYCRYNIDNKCNSSNKKIECTINIVVYNKDEKAASASCSDSMSIPKIKDVMPTGAFHTPDTEKYSCPDLNFVMTQCSGNYTDTNSYNGVGYKSGVLEFSVFPKNYGKGNKYKSQTVRKKGKELYKNNGKDIKSNCKWVNLGIGVNPSKNEKKYLRCEDGSDGADNKSLVGDIRNAAKKQDKAQKKINFEDIEKEISCSDIINGELASFLKKFLLFLSIGSVILFVILMSSDFVKAVASGEADVMADTFKRLKNRIIAVIILLLLPTLVNFIISFLNNNATVVDYGDGKREIKIGNVSDCNIYNK